MEKRSVQHKKIEQISNNPFLNLFHMDTTAKDGTPMQYYFASRNKKEAIKIKTRALTPEGMMIYPILKEDSSKIVLIKQYRYPIDTWVYELPAGLIDPGEMPKDAAVRELKEETGFELELLEETNDSYMRPFFMGPGFTDETSCFVYGYATGVSSNKYMENTEQIEVVLADKRKAKEILSKERVCIRTALLLMQFIQANPKDPFAFVKNESL